MRSRYAAFALGLGGYLIDTLAWDHPERALPREALARELGRTHETQKFLGLRIVETSSNGDEGEVLFVARIFERGRDLSFAELSRFVREDGAWRYASGRMAERTKLPADLDDVTRDVFLEAADDAS